MYVVQSFGRTLDVDVKYELWMLLVLFQIFRKCCDQLLPALLPLWTETPSPETNYICEAVMAILCHR